MPFFVGDCLGSMGARVMTLAERGADVHLLCLNWQQGRLENDPKELARWLDCSLQRFHQIWKGISHKFKEDAQRRIYNPWVEAVKQQSLAGRKGGKATQAERKRGSCQASSKNQPLIFSNPVQDSSSRNNKNTPLPPPLRGAGWRANGLRAEVQPLSEPMRAIRESRWQYNTKLGGAEGFDDAKGRTSESAVGGPGMQSCRERDDDHGFLDSTRALVTKRDS